MNKNRLITRHCIVLLFVGSFILSGCSKWNLFQSDEKLIEEAQELTWLTENFPPYNYGSAGQMHGVGVDVLETLFIKLDIPLSQADFELTDWTEAYDRIQNEKGTALFSMVKNQEREPLFKWVGPIAPHKEVIIAPMGTGIKINQDADLNQYVFGVVAGYPSKNLLIDKGVDRGNIIEYPGVTELYEALLNQDIRCISYSEQANKLVLSGLGENPEDYVTAYTIQVDQLYVAFHPSVSNALINFLQESLDEISNDKSADGSSTLEKILETYSIILQADEIIPDATVTALVEQTATDLATDFSQTIQKMNNQQTPYLNAENASLYSFAYDTELTIVAHAGNPSIVGVNFKGKPDASGKLFRDEILAGALENGTGWADYIYTQPDKSGLFRKTTYYQLVTASNGNQYIVCSGKYK